ncbi:hypothetical protein DICVIV_12517 [Dictyocaulus viviparus]|uniref:G-protein coupled receptors family 1 profile domain-containing protein n=1 Tax=Dictyocaulus viviparus TaxID=29172 RepID=A0A0D8XA84_DICVI|nr:hypothetical protein DICVIV_12517 [Dictyocaulus viviparus]
MILMSILVITSGYCLLHAVEESLTNYQRFGAYCNREITEPKYTFNHQVCSSTMLYIAVSSTNALHFATIPHVIPSHLAISFMKSKQARNGSNS